MKEKGPQLLIAEEAEEWQVLLRKYIGLSDRLDHTLQLIQSHVRQQRYIADGGKYLNGALHQVRIMVEDYALTTRLGISFHGFRSRAQMIELPNQ